MRSRSFTLFTKVNDIIIISSVAYCSLNCNPTLRKERDRVVFLWLVELTVKSALIRGNKGELIREDY